MIPIPTKLIDGDIAVSRNSTIGGNSTVRGSVHVGHDLKVDGYLEAPNIKGVCKGLFPDDTTLLKLYPRPQTGWWALVGDSFPAELYTVNKKGEWSNTGNTVDSTDLKLDLSQCKQDIENLANLIAALEIAHNKLSETVSQKAEQKDLDKISDRLNNIRIRNFDGTSLLIPSNGQVFFNPAKKQMLSQGEYAYYGLNQYDYNDPDTGLARLDTLFQFNNELYRFDGDLLKKYNAEVNEISNAEIDDIIGDLDFDADGNPVFGACTCGPKLGEISREIDRIKSEIDAGADVESIGRQEILALLMENMMPGGPTDTVCACAPKIEALEEHLETMEDELAVESIATDEIMSLLK